MPDGEPTEVTELLERNEARFRAMVRTYSGSCHFATASASPVAS